MCGIAVCLTNNSATGEEFSNDALRLLAHRGPDGQGRRTNGPAWLVHTRLAIQDLSAAGQQPMLSRSGRFSVTFNGEIYNHLELRQKFLKETPFVGHSDTETLLALFEKMGERMLEYLVGMWAFIIWDEVEQRAFVSRDRFGQKPLYWTRCKNTWFFASELKPLLRAAGSGQMNPLAVSEYFALGNYEHLGTETFYEHIFTFQAGHYAYVEPGSSQFVSHSYWSLEEIAYKQRIPLDTHAVREFRELVVNAVSSQLLSDVPVGATLSGGLDSSVIASCIALLGKKHFPVFTAQFPDTPFDETRYVKAMKQRWGSALEVIHAPVQQLNLQDDLERTLVEQEHPFGDPSIMAHGYLVQSASNAGIPVLLGGQGGDEVSMGYPWMNHRLASYSLAHRDYRTLADTFKENQVGANVKLRIILAGLLPEVERKIRLRARLRSKNILTRSWRIPSPGEAFGRGDKFLDIYKESLYSVGLPHLCHYDDRSTMARSIEGRMPFLDHRLYEFASKLQVSAFYSNGFSKYLLREALSDILPAEIANRKDKIGFYTPLQQVVRKNSPWIHTKLRNSTMVQSLLVKGYADYLLGTLQRSTISIEDARRIFRLLSLTIWAENNARNFEKL